MNDYAPRACREKLLTWAIFFSESSLHEESESVIIIHYQENTDISIFGIGMVKMKIPMDAGVLLFVHPSTPSGNLFI